MMGGHLFISLTAFGKHRLAFFQVSPAVEKQPLPHNCTRYFALALLAAGSGLLLALQGDEALVVLYYVIAV